jgi:hypothetical protein
LVVAAQIAEVRTQEYIAALLGTRSYCHDTTIVGNFQYENQIDERFEVMALLSAGWAVI